MILRYAPMRAGVLRRAVQRTSNTSFRHNHQQTHSSTKSTITEPQSLSQPQSTVRTVPSPTAWIWTEPLNAYSRFHGRRPYLTQIISTLTVYLVGDLMSQRISPSPVRSDDKTSTETAYDPFRTARALIIGGMAAVPGYKWFVWLSKSFNYSSKALSLVVKIVINQMVFTPVFNTYFFGMQSLLAGASLSEIIERVKNTVPKSWVNSWKVWPAVMAFNFTYVPLEFRSIFAGKSPFVICVGLKTLDWHPLQAL